MDEDTFPIFRELRIDYKFPPVPYGSPKRIEFGKKIREALYNQLICVGDCSVEIQLRLKQDCSTETDQYADLDNYTKSILDAIKGAEGVILDDCLIHHISISKLEFVYGEDFSIKVETYPEYLMQKPIRLYEMPNGRYYPFPDKIKMQDGSVTEMGEFRKMALNSIFDMTRSGQEWKHQLRQRGQSKEQAFQVTQAIYPVLQGLPKSRVINSGVELVALKDWKK